MPTWRWIHDHTVASRTAREGEELMPDEEALEALTIHCPRRNQSVALEICLDCPEFGGLRWGADGEIAGGRCNLHRKATRAAAPRTS